MKNTANMNGRENTEHRLSWLQHVTAVVHNFWRRRRAVSDGGSHCPEVSGQKKGSANWGRVQAAGPMLLLVLLLMFALCLAAPQLAAAADTNPAVDISSAGSLVLSVEGGNLQYKVGNGDAKTYTGTITVSGGLPSSPTTNTITVASGSHTIILNNVNINVSGISDKAAFNIDGGTAADVVTVILDDGTTNTLHSGYSCAGLQKNYDAAVNCGKLTIAGGTQGTGTLEANGGYYGAGIGGGDSGTGSDITIAGGSVEATGGNLGAKIGNGAVLNGSTNIQGTEVTPTNAASASVYLTTITVKDANDAEVSDTALASLAVTDLDYTYGMKDVKTGTGADDAGKIYVYLPEGKTVTQTTDTSSPAVNYYGSITANTAGGILSAATYAVTLPAAADQVGYTLADKEGSTSPVHYMGSYTFTFELKDGYSNSSTAAVKVNDNPITLNDDGEGTIKDIIENKTVTVTGVAANSYTVAYNNNGGAGTMPNDTHTYDTAQALTANTFVRTGYSFAGWNTAADGSGTDYADQASVKNLTATNGGTVTLYARWTANTYTVVFNANGGTGNMSSDAHTYDVNKELTANSFTRTGYNFVSWNTEENGNGDSYSDGASVVNLTVINNGTVNLYAIWKADKPAAVFTATGADSGILSGVTAGMKYKIVRSSEVIYNQAACNGDADNASLDSDDAVTFVTNVILVGENSDADGWIAITSDEDIVLTGLSGCTIYVKKSGDGSTTLDSAEQQLIVTQAAPPDPENDLEITQPAEGSSGGSITMPEGVDYQYSSDNGDTWQNASGTTELPPGTYLVRIKADGESLASESIEITISEAADPCQGKEYCTLQAGTFNLYLNGIDMGEFTFAPSGSGWTIFSVAAGKYLTQLKGELKLVDQAEADAAVWQYSRGCFYQTEKKTSGWWSWSHTKKTHYYLAAAADGSMTAAKSAKSAAAKLYKNVSSASHNWSDWYTIGNGQHERSCLNCSCTEQGNCQYDQATHKCQQCGACDPAYKSMEVTVKVTSRSTGWLFWKKTYYTAHITPAAVGVTAEKVEYSADNRSWRCGDKYTSRAPISKLYIRVTDSEGTVWNFIYADGTVSRQ